MDFTAGGSPVNDDQIHFVTIASAGDANTQKKLYLGTGSDAWNSTRALPALRAPPGPCCR